MVEVGVDDALRSVWDAETRQRVAVCAEAGVGFYIVGRTAQEADFSAIVDGNQVQHGVPHAGGVIGLH